MPKTSVQKPPATPPSGPDAAARRSRTSGGDGASSPPGPPVSPPSTSTLDRPTASAGAFVDRARSDRVRRALENDIDEHPPGAVAAPADDAQPQSVAATEELEDDAQPTAEEELLPHLSEETAKPSVQPQQPQQPLAQPQVIDAAEELEDDAQPTAEEETLPHLSVDTARPSAHPQPPLAQHQLVAATEELEDDAQPAAEEETLPHLRRQMAERLQPLPAQPAAEERGAAAGDQLAWLAETPALTLVTRDNVQNLPRVGHAVIAYNHDAPLNVHKRQNNDFFAEQLPINGRVLILDGSSLNTTAAIRSARKNVVVDIVEYDRNTARDTFNALLEGNYSNVNVILGQLGTFLKHVPKETRMYDGVFIDTVATWAGNQVDPRA